MGRAYFLTWVAVLSFPTLLTAQEIPLRDVTGDGAVTITAFGDSITFGVGDSGAGGGYPRRLRTLIGAPVTNAGVAGEELIATGVFRIPSVVRGSRSDLFVILEGANDAVKQASSGAFTRSLQRAINIARAEGRQVVVVTPLPPTEEHGALGPFTNAYSIQVRGLAAVNRLPLADAERAWTLICPELESCPLYNLPEGLHPNALGYDALAQVIAATLLGIDIFSPTGPSELESALGLPAGAVVVKGPAAP